MKELKDILGKDKLKLLENCSHYLYTDQQDQFLASFSAI